MISLCKVCKIKIMGLQVFFEFDSDASVIIWHGPHIVEKRS